MARSSLDDDDGQPLDPALEKVQARVRRLLLIAGLTLGVGLFAVFAAILYRIATLDSTSRGATPLAVTLSPDDLGLPDDATLQSTAADGGQLVLTYAYKGGHTVVLVDESSGAVSGRIDLPINKK